MSRSGYNDDCSGWELIMWRGAVESSIRGKRGQQLLRELLVALDAMPVKRLIASELESEGEVCALGCLGKARGMDMKPIDPTDYDKVAIAFGIAPALAREIEYINDDDVWGRNHATAEQRWQTVRKWVAEQIKETNP